MIKDFLLVREASTVPAGALRYREYVQSVHAPRALSVPALAQQMKRFSLCHVIEAPALGCCIHPPMEGITTIVEHVVGGWAGMQRIMVDPQYLATVRPCERYMVETLMDGEPKFIVVDDEQTIFMANPCGQTRMFDFIRKPEEMSRAMFVSKLEEEGAWAIEEAGYRAGVSKRVHSIVGQGEAPFGENIDPFDAIVEVWITDASQLAALIDEQTDRRAAFCDDDRSFTLVTQELRIV